MKKRSLLILVPVLIMAFVNVMIIFQVFRELSSFADVSLTQAYGLHSMTQEIHVINNEIIETHQAVSQMIDKTSMDTIGMLTLYRFHSNVVDTLHEVQLRYEEFLSSAILYEELVPHFNKAYEEFLHYRARILMTTDIIAIDPERANLYRSEAQEIYIQYASDILEALEIASSFSKNETSMVVDKQADFYRRILLLAFLIATLAFIITIALISFFNKYILALLTKVESDALNLKNLNDEKAELISVKDRFFSIISHDLRNPFGAVIGFSDILLTECTACQNLPRYDFIQIIHDSGTSALKLLDNLLAWSRNQMGLIQMFPEDLNLHEVFEELYKELQILAVRKNITIHLDCQCQQIHADLNSLKLIIRNLVTNAIKFTQAGGSVTLQSHLYASDESYCQISIIDTGVGMCSETMENLFLLDKAKSNPGTENETGTGLGIILCKDLLVKNDGKIWVESELGKGSAFHCIFPMEAEPGA